MENEKNVNMEKFVGSDHMEPSKMQVPRNPKEVENYIFGNMSESSFSSKSKLSSSTKGGMPTIKLSKLKLPAHSLYEQKIDISS